mmetsp:Transcript_27959/g.46073  ORF Transcript_27959/g.46073 Transcript_27959/m.46073 type:complete len:241 (+) Transcript_27959:160-882(+)
MTVFQRNFSFSVSGCARPAIFRSAHKMKPSIHTTHRRCHKYGGDACFFSSQLCSCGNCFAFCSTSSSISANRSSTTPVKCEVKSARLGSSFSVRIVLPGLSNKTLLVKLCNLSLVIPPLSLFCLSFSLSGSSTFAINRNSFPSPKRATSKAVSPLSFTRLWSTSYLHKSCTASRSAFSVAICNAVSSNSFCSLILALYSSKKCIILYCLNCTATMRGVLCRFCKFLQLTKSSLGFSSKRN